MLTGVAIQARVNVLLGLGQVGHVFLYLQFALVIRFLAAIFPHIEAIVYPCGYRNSFSGRSYRLHGHAADGPNLQHRGNTDTRGTCGRSKAPQLILDLTFRRMCAGS